MKRSYLLYILCCWMVLSCSDKKELEGGGNFDQQVLLYAVKDGRKTLASSNNIINLELTKSAENTVQSLAYLVNLAKENLTENYSLQLMLDPSAVQKYNQANGTDYLVYPDSLLDYTNTLQIENGTISSAQGSIDIKISEALENNTTYMIALQVKPTGNLKVLPGAETLYFTVIKAIPQVDKSLSLTRDRYLKVENTGSNVSDIGGVYTMEGLVYVERFRTSSDVGDAQISTFMGTEGGALMRFGDAGLTGNQLQAGGSYIADFEENKWYHVAMVVDGSRTFVYVNGELIKNFNGASRISEFYIGKSYNDNRGLWGKVAEIRLWNVVRTAEEIKDNMMGVGTNEPGLYAYWKMNQVVDNKIPDASGNNRDLSFWAQGADKSRKDIFLTNESTPVTIP